MKRVIREGVFETNSSSNHAVFIKRKKSDKKIPGYAVVKPYDKMLFMWGLICCSYDGSCIECFSNEEEGQFHLNESTDIDAECENFKKILIEECLKYKKFNVKKVEEIMNEGYGTRDSDRFTCNKFFYEGLLDDCTCFFEIDDIANFMNIENFDYSEQKFRELVQKFFADKDVYILPISYISSRPKSQDFD